MEFSFKKNFSLENRKEKYNKVLINANGKIPVICEKDPKSDIETIEKTKYLVSPDMTVNQFESIIRKKLKLNKEKALFFIVNGKNAIVGTQLFSEIYTKFKDEDGFLYLAYASEDIWG